MNASLKEPEAQTVGAVSASELEERVVASVLHRVATILQLNPELLEPDSDFGTLGFDSMGLTQLGDSLNESYGLDLIPPIFFEYSTPRRFAAFLVAEYAEKFLPAAPSAPPDLAQRNPVADACDFSPHVSPDVARSAVPARTTTVDGVAMHEPVAVIGMSGCFPKAVDVKAFWRNLLDGLDCIDEIPTERWDWRLVYGDPTQRGKTDVKCGGFIQGIDEFDPLFFGISPRDALLTDPQHRLLMKHVWNCIEDAGHSPRSLSGSRTGVFVGLADTGYTDLLAEQEVRSEGFSFGGRLPSIGVNRVSYLLNLHGPSEPVDSSCSSALVAVHRGVQAIHSGECDAAIVGGVSMMLLGKLHVYLSNAGLLSGDGRCKTFSRHANGYGRGEGVGVVYLKPLSAAERDGDAIYALIRGSGENHGGRAGSLTAPNPVAQAELIVHTYRRAGIDPRTVGYIETHGTGTSLGDPIEINALKSAFAQLGVRGAHADRPFCGLGAVKTNIGHLEPAAGIAGLIKVILQLVHGKLVRSLHCDELNPFIQLEGTPFYIVTESKDWDRVLGESGRPVPRRAGVSSFGIGGVNAHVVLEEYTRPPPHDLSAPKLLTAPALIVLSGRDERGLRMRVQDLLQFLQEGRLGEAALPAIAYTLQVGREAMEHRLALTADNLTGLQQKLTQFLSGDERCECYRGEARRYREAMNVLNDDDDANQLMASWIAHGKHSKLLEMWVRGLAVDWSLLYPLGTPGRVSLPGYSFAKERYWPSNPGRAARGELGREASIPTLHPLVHQNISTLLQMRFRSRFTGNESFLSDCVIRDARTLPAAAHLEMACAALKHASEEPGTAIMLMDVTWMRSVVAGERPTEVDIDLLPEEAGRIRYEVCGKHADADDPVIHSQGTVMWISECEMPQLHLDELWRQCTGVIVEGERFYEQLRALGLSYGPMNKGLQNIAFGTDRNGRRFALGSIRMPEAGVGAREQYTLHPSVVESALQTALGLCADQTSSVCMEAALVVGAMESVEIFASCPLLGLAYVRHDVETQKLDIDLCDDTGAVCLRITGLSFQQSGQEPQSDRLGSRSPRPQRWILLCEGLSAAAGTRGEPQLERACECALAADGSDVRCVSLRAAGAQGDGRFEAYALQLLEVLQEIVKSEPQGEVLLQLVADVQAEPDLCAGLSALLASSALETPFIRSQVIAVGAGETSGTLLEKLRPSEALL